MEHRTTRPEERSGHAEPVAGDPLGERPGETSPHEPRDRYSGTGGADPLADAADGFFDPYGQDRGEDSYRDAPGDPYGTPPPRGGRPDLSAIFVLVDALRHGLPPDLREQFTTLLREALLTLRSLIDWYLERLDRRPREARVEDIPID